MRAPTRLHRSRFSGLKLFASFGDGQEPLRVQAFRPQSAIERLDECVVGQLAVHFGPTAFDEVYIREECTVHLVHVAGIDGAWKVPSTSTMSS